MKITVSVIKADVGGIGGHTRPSDALIDAVKETVKNSGDLLIDHYIGYCGDDVHIVMEKCEHRLRQFHLGPKLKHTSRGYNVTVNHRRRILSCTSGHPARWNDKTLLMYDYFAMSIMNGELQDHEFELYENSDTMKKYTGVWIVVDNGYLLWPILMPPVKNTSSRKAIRWSEWVESMRKDVECTFGILKGRFRILKTGIRVHGVERCDNIFLTCCAIHNWFLEIDGRDGTWESSAAWFDSADEVQRHVPFALRRLNNPAAVRMGLGTPSEETYDVDNMPVRGTHQINNDTLSTNVLNLDHEEFRKKLITHFDVLFQKRKISWPTRK